MVRHFFMLLTELVSNQCEALEGSNLQILVLLGESLSRLKRSIEPTQMFRPIY